MKKDDLSNLLKNIPAEVDILGRDKYFHSVVLVPFIEIEGELHLLFQKRAKNIRQGGEISFPGGGFDPNLDDDISQTARRETIEEIGIDADKVHILKRFHTVVNPLGNVIDVFVGHLDINDINKLDPNETEVDYLFTVPFSYFKNNHPKTYKLKVEVNSQEIDVAGNRKILFPAQDLKIPEKYYDTWSGRKLPVYCWQINNETIWGITAEIIYELTKLY